MEVISWHLISLILIVCYVPNILTISLDLFIEPEALDALRKDSNLKAFVKYLGIPNEDLCHPSKDDNMQPMFNEELAFGDLILDENPEESEGLKEDKDNTEHDYSSEMSSTEETDSKSGSKKNKWKNGVIPYYISNDYTAEQKEQIGNAIYSMNSKLTRVQFRPFNRFVDKNYVFIFSGKGCYAKLGMAGGQQPLSLQSDKCLKTGVIQHELMHVVGFSHEQNRPDRDDYIKMLPKNIPEKWLKEYKRKNPSQAAFVGKYDYYSAMHYPSEAPGTDGEKRAFKILDDTIDDKLVGNKEKLSKMDTEKIDYYYS